LGDGVWAAEIGRKWAIQRLDFEPNFKRKWADYLV